MNRLLFIAFFIFLNACSFNINSKYWNEKNDKKSERTYVARDLYGVRPLFVAERNNLVIFSSEMKMIPNNMQITNIKPGVIGYETKNYVKLNVSTFKPGMYAVYDVKGDMIRYSMFAQPNMIAFNGFVENQFPSKASLRKYAPGHF